MSDRGYGTTTTGYVALVDGVVISESMAKKALEITAKLRAAEEERQEKKRQEEEERKKLSAAKHMHVRQCNGGGADSPYLLLDPAKVRTALACIDGRKHDGRPYMLTLHENGDVHFDYAEPVCSTDHDVRLHLEALL